MGKGPTQLLIAFEDAVIKDLGAHVFEYTERDSILYNLGLGCKWDEARYVYENDSQFGVLPTFPVIPPFHGVLSELPLQDILPNFNPVGTSVGSVVYLLQRFGVCAQSPLEPWNLIPAALYSADRRRHLVLLPAQLL